MKLAEDLTYTPPLDSAQIGATAEEAAPTLVAKLKDSGVTTILVLPTDYQMTAALTKAATKNDYHPEWISMGLGNSDIDGAGPDLRPGPVEAHVRNRRGSTCR